MEQSGGGWHPDPGGCWEHRWWDGTAWTDQVCTGTYTATEPLPVDVRPPANRDEPLLELLGSKAGHDPDKFVLTWSALQVWRQKDAAPAEVLPLWMVKHIEVWEGAVKSMTGVADLRVTVGYEGYVGPAIRKVANVKDAHWAKAMVWRQRGLCAVAP